ncbi:MAG: hypothetical protein EXR69_11295 [Myxococcales bacterium]|nr:hypothetical protein [Myxococcales bacterium]
MSQVDLIAAAREVVGPGPDMQASLAGTPRTVPSGVRAAGIAAMAIGALCLIGGLAFGDHDTQNRTLGVFLTCLVYFIGVAQGGVMFSVAQTASLGRWGRPFKRIAESFGMFLPFLWLMYAAFMIGGGLRIYSWHETPIHSPHKAIYLQSGFFIGRQLVGTLILFTLSMLFVRNSLRPDLGVAAEMLGSRAPAWWGRVTAGWRGRTIEVEDAYQKNIRLAPVMILSYAIIMTMVAVDAVMSLAPHWASNMFPGWIFMSSWWLAINWICIISVFSRRWLGVEHLITPKHYHDLGKMMFALCVFWTYTFFAQVLPIWYGNMPEETSYLLLRMFVDPWASFSKLVGAMCFLFPFTVLLSRGIKKMPSSLVAVAMVIALGIFFERFLLVMPQVWMKDSLPLGPVEFGIFAGFIGGFVTVVTTFLSQVPAVPFTDPFMNPNPADIHVHAIGDHGDGHHQAHG